eukprot:5974809-Pyramimonas_sp.AAC.1
MPLHVMVDVSRFIDAMQCFRCPTVMGPGKAKQWGVHPNYGYHTAGLTRHMQARGMAVLSSDQWVKSYDRLTPTDWHAKMNNHNMAMMTTQYCDAVCCRNFCAVIQSLPSQPYPFRPPVLKAVTDSQAYTQAQEISVALKLREKMTDEWKRHLSLTTSMNQAAGEMVHCAWMA